MKKFNSTILCLAFLLFMVDNTAFAQDFALNINLSNVEKPVAKYSLLSPRGFSNTISYTSLVATNSTTNLLENGTSTSIMFAQSNSRLYASKFVGFTATKTPTNSSSFRISFQGVLANGLSSVLGCTAYPSSVGNSSLATYYGNGTSSGTPILNNYYNGSTNSTNTGGQARTVTRSTSSNFIRLRKQ